MSYLEMKSNFAKQTLGEQNDHWEWGTYVGQMKNICASFIKKNCMW